MDKVGEFVIKGLAYNDVVEILTHNGYATEVFTSAYEVNTRVGEMEHVIRVYKVKEGI